MPLIIDRVQWEYLVVRVQGNEAQQMQALNQAGAEGWEAFGMSATGFIQFKRPKE